MLLSLVALILLPALIWAVMEWAYYRELAYQRRCFDVKTVRLITDWPGRHEWRLAERLANERPLAAPEVVPENLQWREPDILPDAIAMEAEPEEPLNIVHITAALEANPACGADASGAIITKAAPHRRRKVTTRIRRAAG